MGESSRETVNLPDEAATRALGARLAVTCHAGDVVLLHGELGAGKTTLVRGLLEALGWTEPVRSPTFNLVQVFPTKPPVLHADLYRLKSAAGLGLEDYEDTHLCLLEWPERVPDLNVAGTWSITIRTAGEGRVATVERPFA